MATAELTTDLLPEVRDFLSRDEIQAVIGGKSVSASDGNTFDTFDPGSGQKLASVSHLTADDVDRAVQAAQKAFDGEWSRLTSNERAALLHRFADTIEQHKPILSQIESLDAGKILAQAQGDVQNVIDTLRYYTDLSQHIQHRTVLGVKGHEAWTVRKPWGPCGFIIPWNFPMILVGWNISPALAAGNTVVIKPAEDTPLSAIYLAELAKKAGLPDGVVNVVTGHGATTGVAVSSHPGFKRMSFTGSPEVGRLVAASCGKNLIPVKLELGGKGAAVVFDDVDVAKTATKLAQAITFHSGQVCCDATRWLVQKSIYDQFVDECVTRLQKVQVGYQLDGASQMGPVVNGKQKQRILGYLEKGQAGGAELVLDGGEADVSGRGGYYVRPSLLAGSLDNVAAKEEIFGPVAYLCPFEDEADAIRLTNSSNYGLANSVWTTDLVKATRVAEQLVAGNSWINAHNVFVHGVPYAGINKSGMGGGVLSVETLLDYWRNQSIVRPL